MTLGLFDYISIAVFVLAVLICTIRGFIKSIAGIARIVGAFFLAKIFGSLLGRLIATAIVGPAVYEWLEARVGELVGENLSELFTENAEALRALLGRFGAADRFESLRDSYGESVEATEEAVSLFVKDFATPWVERLSAAIGCVIVFIVAFIVIFFLTKLLLFIVERIELLNRTDHLLGFLLGLVGGVYSVIAVCYLVNLLCGALAFVGSSADPLLSSVESSMLFEKVYRFVMGIR